MYHLTLLCMIAAPSALAFPFVANLPGVNNEMLEARRAHYNENQKRQTSCPINPNHPGAHKYVAPYLYTGANHGLPGSGIGCFDVPIPGDPNHYFEAPGPLDIRGPCPGLNTAANYHFISHDGIMTFAELLDAQQNIFNVGYDLAVTLAALGVGLTGDIVTEKMSIGCDATSRTSALGGLQGVLGKEGGINDHNKFEQDTSLSRTDFFFHGDDHTFNASIWKEVTAVTSGFNNLFNRDAMAKIMSERYKDSAATNPNFYFGPKSVILYGAASFLYELIPSLGNQGIPTREVVNSFFGAKPDGSGGFTFVPERIPDSWDIRPTPFTNADVAAEVVALYSQFPVPLGGNVGINNFNAMGSFGTAIQNGKLSLNPKDVKCLLYQIATENVPDSLSTVLELPLNVLNFMTGKLNPVFAGSGCPLKLT
ncbi:hypothetical protein B0A49_04790 [Cryomyces minteri]|uniref:Heme haloperoxidase family profile domain-containing protein n=1 Tax=Cryomyces minteri TaxID=331657 RepID=A0A4U0XJF9_9PEZI|nr:hypothetical protein B0A49_04790 [Cryomyces minteri]